MVSASCPNDQHFENPEYVGWTCANPVSAVESFLTGNPMRSGPCAVFQPRDRFVRFREWINSMGGIVSDKIDFNRGYFVDPSNGKLSYSVGGVFLKPHEELVQSEILMYIPLRATFSEHMIRAHIPWFRKFLHIHSPRLWMSFGLAALIAHFPDVVGPWAALLPEMDYHPIFWPESDINQFVGTNTFQQLAGIRKQISQGCIEHANHLESLDITCRQVSEAYAIIMSRAFGLEITPGDSSSAIPFGPDFLNHSPHSVSWISLVNAPSKDDNFSPQQILESDGHVIYYLRSFVLGPTRELYNNYGQHGMSVDMALYGFTSPDNHDELVIVSTLGGFFAGTHYPLTRRDICPKQSGQALTRPPQNTCLLQHYKTLEYHQDSAGYFRVTKSDYINFHPSSMLKCSNTVDGLQWTWIMNQLRYLNVRYDNTQYLLHLNVMDGAEPHMNHPTSVWMSVCALPPMVKFETVLSIVEELSQCKESHTSKYYHHEEYPLHPGLRNLAKKSLLNLCTLYQSEVLGHYTLNFFGWIGARNELCRRRGCWKGTEVESETMFQRPFIKLLTEVNADKDRLWTDNGGPIGAISIEYQSRTRRFVHRAEEILKFKMQLSYMLSQKCRNPLEAVVHQRSLLLLEQSR